MERGMPLPRGGHKRCCPHLSLPLSPVARPPRPSLCPEIPAVVPSLCSALPSYANFAGGQGVGDRRDQARLDDHRRRFEPPPRALCRGLPALSCRHALRAQVLE